MSLSWQDCGQLVLCHEAFRLHITHVTYNIVVDFITENYHIYSLLIYVNFILNVLPEIAVPELPKSRCSAFRGSETLKARSSAIRNPKMLKIGISGLIISDNKRYFCLCILFSCVYKSRQVSSVVSLPLELACWRPLLYATNKDRYYWRIPSILFSLTKRYVQPLSSIQPTKLLQYII